MGDVGDREFGGSRTHYEPRMNFRPGETQYDLNRAVTDTGRLRRSLIRRANKDLEALMQDVDVQKSSDGQNLKHKDKELIKRHASSPPETTSYSSEGDGILKDKDIEHRGAPRTNKNSKMKYALRRGLGDETHLPDRPPGLDPQVPVHFAQAVKEILERHGGEPESAKLEDLRKIIDAEKKDLADLNDSYSRLSEAFTTAKTFLVNELNPEKLIVSVFKNDADEWEAKVGAKKGSLYFTFTGRRIIDLGIMLSGYRSSLKVLDFAQNALDKIVNGKKLVENGYEAQALY